MSTRPSGGHLISASRKSPTPLMQYSGQHYSHAHFSGKKRLLEIKLPKATALRGELKGAHDSYLLPLQTKGPEAAFLPLYLYLDVCVSHPLPTQVTWLPYLQSVDTQEQSTLQSQPSGRAGVITVPC